MPMATARVSTPAAANPGAPSSDRRAILKSCLIGVHLWGRLSNLPGGSQRPLSLSLFGETIETDQQGVCTDFDLQRDQSDIKLRGFPSAQPSTQQYRKGTLDLICL